MQPFLSIERALKNAFLKEKFFFSSFTKATLWTICLAVVFSNQIQAQDDQGDEFTFLKTIDQVEIYYKKVFCDDNVEFLIVKAINKGTSSVSLELQPAFKTDTDSFSSESTLSFTLNGGATIEGDCDTSNLRVSVFEFFSTFDSNLVSFDLTKIS